MIRTLLFLIYAVIGLILIIPFAIIGYFMDDKDPLGKPGGIGCWIVKYGIPPAVKIWGIKVKKSGEENILDEPALYVGNHQGNCDIALILTQLGDFKSIVAKKEISKLPVVAPVMRQLKCIFIDRKDMRQSLKCMKIAEQRLASGQSVVIFPEGTRSQGPDMGEFKSGAFRCAIKAGVKIVPFVIDGSYNAFEAHHVLKPAEVKFSVLPAVDPAELGLAHGPLADHVKGLIQDELCRLRGVEAPVKTEETDTKTKSASVPADISEQAEESSKTSAAGSEELSASGAITSDANQTAFKVPEQPHTSVPMQD